MKGVPHPPAQRSVIILTCGHKFPYAAARERPPSSSGLGYQVLNLETGVRLPLGVISRVGNSPRFHALKFATERRSGRSGPQPLTQPLRQCFRFRFGGRRINCSRCGSIQNPVDSRTVTPRSGSSLSPANTNVPPANCPSTSITPNPMSSSCHVPSASSYARRPAGRIPNLRSAAPGTKVSVAPVSTSNRPVHSRRDFGSARIVRRR